jgi:hypothetical protein
MNTSAVDRVRPVPRASGSGNLLSVSLRLLRLLVATAALGACVPATLAAQSVRADFNGDGVQDDATFSADFRGVVVHIGRARAVLPLHASEAVVAIATADIDRDGDLDLIVRLSRSGIHLWRNADSGRFVKVRHRRHVLPPLLAPGRGNLAGGDPDLDHVATGASSAPSLRSARVHLVHEALARGAIPDRAGTRPLQETARTQIPRAPPAFA